MYVKSVKTLLFDNIYIDRFLLVDFVKYILSQIYSHPIQSCTFWYFLEIMETFAFEENIFSLIIFMFLFYPDTNNFNNSEIFGRRKLTDIQ